MQRAGVIVFHVWLSYDLYVRIPAGIPYVTTVCMVYLVVIAVTKQYVMASILSMLVYIRSGVTVTP